MFPQSSKDCCLWVALAVETPLFPYFQSLGKDAAESVLQMVAQH